MQRLQDALEAESLGPATSLSDGIAWLSVPSQGVSSLWWRLRRSLSEHGWHPLIASPTEAVQQWMKEIQLDPRPLPSPNEQELSKFIARRRRELVEEFGDPEIVADLKVDRAALEMVAPGPKSDFEALRQRSTGQPWPEVILLFVRAGAAWQIPHAVGWGGFNDCPHPSELSLALWSWQKRFNALPAALGESSLELFLQKPLSTADDVAAVAEEMAIIAPDLVWQGTETAQNLAQEIAGRHIWFLWWN